MSLIINVITDENSAIVPGDSNNLVINGGLLVLVDGSPVDVVNSNGKVNEVGDLIDLSTTDKSSIVNAVNEVNSKSVSIPVYDGSNSSTGKHLYLNASTPGTIISSFLTDGIHRLVLGRKCLVYVKVMNTNQLNSLVNWIHVNLPSSITNILLLIDDNNYDYLVNKQTLTGNFIFVPIWLNTTDELCISFSGTSQSGPLMTINIYYLD